MAATTVAGQAATAATPAALAPMGEIENEAVRQMVTAKTGAATKVAGVGAKGAAGATIGKTSIAGAKGGGILSSAKGSAILAGKGLALGTWGPVILGVVGAAVAYRCFKNRQGGSYDQSETDLEIKEALG